MSAKRDRVLVCDGRHVDERVVLAILTIGTFIAPLDSSIVNIALPAMAADFGARLTSVGWVATAYVLTTASFVLAMGRLADIYGLRRVYVSGFLVFATGSAACALVPSLGWLIAARVFQAIGAAAMFAAGPALVSRTFPPQRRGWALGWISLAVSAGLTIGPALGGTLVALWGWQGIFLVNIPLALVTAGVARALLPEDCPDAEPFDIAGAALVSVTLTSALLALSETARSGVIAPTTIGLAAVAVVAGMVFVRVERRVAHPLVDLGMFRRWRFSAGLISAVLSFTSLFAVTFTMPFYLLKVQGLAPQTAGLLLTATPLTMALFAPAAGRASDRMGSRRLSTAGLVLLAVTLTAMTRIAVDTHPGFIVLALVGVGTGLSVFSAPNTADILRATPRTRVGVGSALVGQARNLGIAFGVGVTALVISLGLGGADLMSSEAVLVGAEAELFVSAMRSAFVVAAVVAALGAAIAWSRGEATDADAIEVDAGFPARVDLPARESGEEVE